MIIGIDLGTTNSVAAYLADGAPRLVPNALGESLTPSVVGLDETGRLLVGRIAKEYQVLHPERCAATFKRYMGTDWSIDLGGRKFAAEQLSSLVLRTLKEDAVAHLGQPIERAVITVPAYFNDLQRKATIRAGQLAGLHVERILNEPTAAAIAYGMHETSEDKVVVVLDLGGGTFDVSVVELFEGSIEVRASSGEAFLGGEDFTRSLAARVLETKGHLFERAELEMPALVSRMLQQCERAKCQLTKQDAVSVKIPNANGEIPDDATEVQVSRAQFEKWTEHILARIDLPLRRALGDANLKRSDVREVILVGGATRMRAVVDRVMQTFKQPPHSRLNPDEVVALGAAVQAGLVAREQSLSDLVVTDVAPFTMGVEISKRLGMEHREGYFLPVIPRNSTIPISRVERVSTIKANQTTLAIKVFQGEGRKVKDNLLLGELEITGIPRGPAGQNVDVRFTYDLNGVLEVEVVIVETQKKASLVIARYAKGLTEQQIARAVERMNELKTHPREETANRFLLKRAERVYGELPEMERKNLAELMDGFEEALALQEPEAIDRNRAALEQYLSVFDKRFDEGPDENDDDSW